MIYGTNRTASLGNISVGVDSRYFGEGAFAYAQECAQDELAMFEAAIKSDIDEAILTREGYVGESAELVALNENFITSAMEKVKKMMKKLIAWIESVMRSAFAKLTQLVVRDNGKFCKIARKQIMKMKNSSKFEYNGKAVDAGALEEAVDDIFATYDGLENKFSDNAKINIKDFEDAEKKMDDLSLSDLTDKVVIEVDDKPLSFINDQLSFLEKHAKKNMQDLKKAYDKAKKGANKIYNDAVKAENKLKSDAKEEEKTAASDCTKAAAIFKQCTQKACSMALQLLTKAIKAARSAVSKAMGATPKNESFISAELIDAMNESVLLEYDEALEEMSEGGDCEDTDEDILDDDED